MPRDAAGGQLRLLKAALGELDIRAAKAFGFDSADVSVSNQQDPCHRDAPRVMYDSGRQREPVKLRRQ
jgi:hypothetical protein